MTADSRAVSEVGEQGLLALLAPRLKQPPSGDIWSGDDAAVIDVPNGRAVLTTDVIVEDVDFRLDTFGPEDIGWKALAVNVSDIAAMGATPLYALATISLHPDTPVALFEGVADGLFEAAEAFGVYLIGGDISEASELSVSVTALGIPGERAVTRAGAQVGDAICVTGPLGGAAAGLFALERGLDAPSAIERQRRPRPKIHEGLALAPIVTAMIDLSDGLARDLGHIVEASGVGCEVDLTKIPIQVDVVGLHPELRPPFAAVLGGEDYELLFTVPEVESIPDGVWFRMIGRITDGDATIEGSPLDEWKEKAWDHLRDR